MTYRDEVLNLLKVAGKGVGLTDASIAARLDIPEPSARRARRQLVIQGMVEQGVMIHPEKVCRWRIRPIRCV